MIKDPKKAIYNKVYNKTTKGVDLDDKSADSDTLGCGFVLALVIITYIILDFVIDIF